MKKIAFLLATLWGGVASASPPAVSYDIRVYRGDDLRNSFRILTENGKTEHAFAIRRRGLVIDPKYGDLITAEAPRVGTNTQMSVEPSVTKDGILTALVFRHDEILTGAPPAETTGTAPPPKTMTISENVRSLDGEEVVAATFREPDDGKQTSNPLASPVWTIRLIARLKQTI